MDEITLLKDYNLKVTPQRVAIVELLKEHGHLSIATMYELIRKKFPSISLATIYKNVNAMIESGFLNEVKIVGQDSRYELCQPAHSHIVCRECGDLMDLDIASSQIVDEVESKSGFKVESASMIFYGVCKKCLD